MYLGIIRKQLTTLLHIEIYIIVDSIIGITLDSNGHYSRYLSITVDPLLNCRESELICQSQELVVWGGIV